MIKNHLKKTPLIPKNNPYIYLRIKYDINDSSEDKKHEKVFLTIFSYLSWIFLSSPKLPCAGYIDTSLVIYIDRSSRLEKG